MSLSEEQQEEMEVLNSIFDGDNAFKQITETKFQYKVGEDGDNKSFLIEISWPKEYPACKPEMNLDAFYNKHIVHNVKEQILQGANEQAEMMLGEAVTYSVIDWAKENLESLMADQPEAITREVEVCEKDTTVQVSKKKEKKEQLTKAQKRKLADRIDVSGERPRGWNWVDIVKHLSQTGKSSSDTG